ncbi:hypothetical protein PGN35_018725 [Nodosilinea sp. PGN35]|uniref:hypothetical protein n=1 Tax=Nodosilinea sp. PGN35 TaxID=3020489 RepID=UPI0023B305D5|nr:hypothetical protein [Nodosilinea sp. TSF1-S3]MDF0366745.1 hypothetical protein [Nodosilinea sp. TSF1-S3]
MTQSNNRFGRTSRNGLVMVRLEAKNPLRQLAEQRLAKNWGNNNNPKDLDELLQL